MLSYATASNRFDKLLLKSDVFVDKSLFIKEFLESQEEVTLITRPRRWGKSLNMDMLKRFLNIEVDDQGKPLPQEQSLNRKLFVGGEVVIGSKTGKVKQLFPLKIAQQCPDLINDYQGQYPVISIGFKDVKGSSYQAIEAGVKTQIIDLYTEGSYLYPCIRSVRTTLEGAQKEQLRRYIDGEFNEEDIKNSLRFLGKLLYKHFKKPVYVLIDEYDAPINDAYVKCKDRPEEFQKILELFQNLLGATLKSNPHLEQSLVTGILRIAKSNLFSDLNNMREYTLLDKRFSTSYGFTQQEVDELLDKVPISTPVEKIQHWYNGYTFGGQVCYNSWSVMCCLSSEGSLDRYWIDSGGTKLLDSVLGRVS
ncbi:MAG: AAA family ATPase [Bacteroidota bacterium]